MVWCFVQNWLENGVNSLYHFITWYLCDHLWSSAVDVYNWKTVVLIFFASVMKYLISGFQNSSILTLWWRWCWNWLWISLFLCLYVDLSEHNLSECLEDWHHWYVCANVGQGVVERTTFQGTGKRFHEEGGKIQFFCWSVMHVQKFNPRRFPWNSLSGKYNQQESNKANSGDWVKLDCLWCVVLQMWSFVSKRFSPSPLRVSGVAIQGC